MTSKKNMLHDVVYTSTGDNDFIHLLEKRQIEKYIHDKINIIIKDERYDLNHKHIVFSKGDETSDFILTCVQCKEQNPESLVKKAKDLLKEAGINCKNIYYVSLLEMKLYPGKTLPKDLLKAYLKNQIELRHVNKDHVLKNVSITLFDVKSEIKCEAVFELSA